MSDDSISRQAAIRVIARFKWDIDADMVFRIQKGLVELPSAQPEQRWIPCSERLPLEKEADYWICTNTGYQCQCRWTRNRYGLGVYDKWGWKLFDIPQYTHVVAWQPLPPAYREKNHE